MSARTLVTIVLLASTVLTMGCQNKDRTSSKASDSHIKKAKESEDSRHDIQACPAHIGGTWNIGTSSQTLKFDTTNGQIKIQVPMGDESSIDGNLHALPGGNYIGYCIDGRLSFIVTQVSANDVIISKVKWLVTTVDRDNGQVELSVAKLNDDTGEISAPKTERFDLSRLKN